MYNFSRRTKTIVITLPEDMDIESCNNVLRGLISALPEGTDLQASFNETFRTPAKSS